MCLINFCCLVTMSVIVTLKTLRLHCIRRVDRQSVETFISAWLQKSTRQHTHDSVVNLFVLSVFVHIFRSHWKNIFLSVNKTKCISKLDAHASTSEWNLWAALALWVWRTTGQWRGYEQRVYSTFGSTYVYSRSMSALRWCERLASTWVWRLQAPVVERERERAAASVSATTYLLLLLLLALW